MRFNACHVIERTRLILLDEPDAGLDENTIQQLISDINKLRSLGHGFLITSHNKEMMNCATAIHDLTALKQIDHQQHDAWEVTSTDIETPLFATYRLEIEFQHIGLSAKKLVSGFASVRHTANHC